MKLDVVIRVNGSVRKPAEHIAALLPEVGGDDVTVLVTEPFAAAGYDQVTDTELQEQRLDAGPDEAVLVYGDEHLLGVIRELPVDTIWMTLGAGANPLRNVWRLRGAHAWLGVAKIALLLEDEAGRSSLGNSPLLNTGRISRILTVPSYAEAEAAQQAVAASVLQVVPVVEVPEEAEDVRGAIVQMGEEKLFAGPTAVLEANRETEQALLNRYNLVKERRQVAVRTAEVEAVLSSLLKEVFASRFAVGPESAGAFAELTGKLARSAAEYQELVENRVRVEEQLQALAWLKAELDM
ncbi:MAG TPA: hypothetical protein VNT01_17570 [Symbiobacteriaceae bacterium]|nr:hypothetical protein [Symbiobacteriaceae bacterium]